MNSDFQDLRYIKKKQQVLKFPIEGIEKERFRRGSAKTNFSFPLEKG
jgi:hypothetical protein